MTTRYEMYSEEWYQWEAISKMVKKNEDATNKREDSLRAAEKEKQRVRQAQINNDRMDYEMYLERKREKERLANEVKVVEQESCKSEIHVPPMEGLLIGGGKDEEEQVENKSSRVNCSYVLQPYVRRLDRGRYMLVKFLFRQNGRYVNEYIRFDRTCIAVGCERIGHTQCSCTMMVEGLGHFKGYTCDIEVAKENIAQSAQRFFDDLISKYELKEDEIVSKYDASSRAYFSLTGKLSGVAKRKKMQYQYEGETHVMDSILGGRKQSRVVNLQVSLNLPPAEKWVDLMRILRDEYYILLDETLELDTKGTVKIVLEVYSHVDQILACNNPDSQPLRDMILPYVRCLEKQCAARYIFRCRGRCLEDYFIVEILPVERCSIAKAHSRMCICTVRIRGINSLYGYASEFSMNNESSRLQFLADLNERFEVKRGKVQVKGAQQGFEFSQKNCFDLFCNETRVHDRGGSVLTSIKYVKMIDEDIVVEKTQAQIILCLAPGKYDFVAVPTAKKPNDKLIDYFDQLKAVDGAIEAEAEVTDGMTKVYLSQRKGSCIFTAATSGILKLKGGRCKNIVDMEDDSYWLVAWRRARNLAFSEAKYISVLHCLLPREDMKGRIGGMKSKIDLNLCYETVPSCSNY